jgi:AcrR family transcriptional regulator
MTSPLESGAVPAPLSEQSGLNVQKARSGRPAAASRGEAVARASRWLLEGRRLEMQALARELGVGRTTLHGWFGSRQALAGEAFAHAARELLPAIRARVAGAGAAAILETLRRYDRAVATQPAIGRLARADPVGALRLVTDPDGPVHRIHIALFERLIADEVAAGAYIPPIPVADLAYALVSLGEHALFVDAAGGAPDLERLAVVQAHLLGVDQSSASR